MPSQPTFDTTNSAFRQRIGRLKKYDHLWNTINKRVYVLGSTLDKLECIKG